MGNTYNFKVGFQPFNLMPPAGTPAGMESYIWTLEEWLQARGPCRVAVPAHDTKGAERGHA